MPVDTRVVAVVVLEPPVQVLQDKTVVQVESVSSLVSLDRHRITLAVAVAEREPAVVVLEQMVDSAVAVPEHPQTMLERQGSPIPVVAVAEEEIRREQLVEMAVQGL
jgi:hypothetical protein